jgi:hypothetical protein
LALNLHFPYLFSLVENKAFKVADAGKWLAIYRIRAYCKEGTFRIGNWCKKIIPYTFFLMCSLV